MANPDTTAPVLKSITLPKTIDVTNGGSNASFTVGATDVGLGVDHVYFGLDHAFQTSYGNQSGLSFYDTNDSFSDGFSSLSQFFSSSTAAGTYNITSASVYDKAGNYTYYTANQLASLGVSTSFQVASGAAADTTAPVLKSITLPKTIDVTNGGSNASFTVGATDVGLGVDHVYFGLDHAFQTSYGNQSGLSFYDTNDSFSDGFSSLSQFFSSSTAAGTYNITSASVYDKAGNYTYYTANQLASLGVTTSFQVIDHNATPTAAITGPASVKEGQVSSFALDLTLKNVSTASGTVSISYDASQSTAVNGTDVSVPNGAISYSISQSPSGPYVLHLPSISITDDHVPEAPETLAIKVYAPGLVFDTGTDTTTFKLTVLDSGIGTAGNDTLTGTRANDVLQGLAGDDVLIAGGGRDIIDGGDGVDTLVLSGAASSYTAVASGGISYLLGADGSGVQVSNVEQVRFADGNRTYASVVAGQTGFDGLAYIASYKDLIAAFGVNGAGGAQHFVASGFTEGRTVTFNALAYLAANPDLIRAFGDDAITAERHYITTGAAEGRTTTFDAERYLASNPDLLRAFGDDASRAEHHYIDAGLSEGRAAQSFNPLEYLASNPDLLKAFGSDTAAATHHYAASGFVEGRQTTSFDAYAYLASNPDLLKAFGSDTQAALSHYVSYGFAEGRADNTFDAKLYSASSTDLAKAFGENTLLAEQHYVLHGAAEGRPTTGFDSVAYLLSNSDLAAAGFDPQTALDHWLSSGAKEGRAGDTLFGREQSNHAMTLGQTTNDQIDGLDDHDWFSLTLTAGQHVEIDTTAGQFAAAVGIYDSHGVQVTSTAAAAAARATSTVFTADHNGVYYVTMTDNNHSGTGSYAIASHILA